MKGKTQKVPAVLLLAFKRPNVTRRVLNEIRKARPKKLFFAVDGAREGNKDDEKKTKEVRELISEVDWPCKVKTLFRNKNLGTKWGIIEAINWFFSHVNQGIILEDDCIPNQSFFRFCQEMLEKYHDDDRVMHIAGSNPHRGWKRDKDYSYYFSNYTLSWGWATWKRAWEKFDPDVKTYPEIKRKGYLKDIYPRISERVVVQKGFDAVCFKGFDVWDHQWLLTPAINSALSIIPNENLIQNMGTHSEGTHTTSTFDKELSLKTSELKFPLKHPPFMIRDDVSDRRYVRWMFMKRIRNQLIRTLRLSKFFQSKE
ncbi:nucleotide-diphospho-sugar transferase [archaeon]|jgi:hypothetical protein|nr:nucleotide-diphospho-sugar transferase [archaeon]MBT3578290.1 nucleotide-diphospho-sugar transferase [archaeon]MBT6819789.1 nucleotide-diphospho-sugar transferase [archaeon]MBT6955814.1 nucleotide-diphospho-sugar transferase [archaeon]MBT7025571.1 nucleotide-diphospho-sugar transferase [archaeon]